MHVPKQIERLVKIIFDEILPPCLRDSKLFMWLPFRLLFRDKANYFLEFKEKSIFMSESEIIEVYKRTAPVHIQQKGTDLANQVLAEILANVAGEKILDVGCGNGILASKLADVGQVTACDIVLDAAAESLNPGIRFREADCEHLPFADNEFDTVTCTHTLEHVRHLEVAIDELRRVARTKLIIVLPRERQYRYTFNLHLHFFPYRHNILAAFNSFEGKRNFIIKAFPDCWYYQESYDIA